MDSIFPQYQINRTIYSEGKEYLFFSGTSYLGISASPYFSALLKEGIDLLGIHHGLSRINNVQLAIYKAFEDFFASQAKAERALLFSSGFLAGHAVISFLEDQADVVFIAPDTHPAVLSKANRKHIYSSAKEWINSIENFALNQKGKNVLILANAVNVLQPEIYDFSWIAELPITNNYTLLIDDSHAFGTVGSDIFGTYAKWKHLPVRLLISGSLGKGLGLPAGVVLGDQISIEQVSKQAIFRSASPPPPAYLWAFFQAQEIYKKQQEKLKDNIHYFKKLAKDLDLQTCNEDFPVFRFEESNLLPKLQEHQIIVSSFPYPAPNDPPVHRIVISAWHEKADLLALIRVLMN